MPSQQSLSSHSMFLIPWDTSANNPLKEKVFHIIQVESKSISYHAFSLSFSLSLFSSAGQGEREQLASTWYQSSDLESTALNPFLIAYLALLSSTHLQHLMLPLRLPLLPGEQIREVKMIPRSTWRQCANSSSTRDKEKESKWLALGKIEERNRPSHLPRACLPCRRNKQRRMQTAQPRNSDIPHSEFQTSSRSKLWKVNKIIYLQNHICVLKLYSVWFLLC
ncbi:hypothetical protein ACFX12_018229 [Malus domestica]